MMAASSHTVDLAAATGSRANAPDANVAGHMSAAGPAGPLTASAAISGGPSSRPLAPGPGLASGGRHHPAPLRVSPSDPLRELFEACKSGDATRVRELVNPSNVNARDTAGRRSSPLHFAAGKKERVLRVNASLMTVSSVPSFHPLI